MIHPVANRFKAILHHSKQLKINFISILIQNPYFQHPKSLKEWNSELYQKKTNFYRLQHFSIGVFNN